MAFDWRFIRHYATASPFGLFHGLKAMATITGSLRDQLKYGDVPMNNLRF
jgi:hypothetical protein